MDSDVSEDYQSSDSEVDEKTHASLIENVLNLSSKQHVKKSSRTEPTIKISEFDLIKSGVDVDVAELTDVLKNRTKQVEIGKKVRATENKSKTLPKPLDQPQADRIRRTVAYNSTKEQLDRWEPIVTSLRSAIQVKYPLKQDYSFEKKEKPDITANFRIKSDLQKRLEEIEPPVEVFKIEQESEKFPLTLEEILEKRKESAKFRAQQSYQESKARRQNKIKSKKYHRVERREKAKQQLKEFELLQKTDPEAALKKLDEIERVRAEERASLRHKTTGKWAKNKQIRAKYDKDSRQALAEQLTISRNLTQKIKNVDSDSDVDGENTEPIISSTDQSNPWISGVKVSKEVEDFVSGYRKYWEEKNIKNVENRQSINQIKDDKIIENGNIKKFQTNNDDGNQINNEKKIKGSNQENFKINHKEARKIVENCSQEKIENCNEKKNQGTVNAMDVEDSECDYKAKFYVDNKKRKVISESNLKKSKKLKGKLVEPKIVKCTSDWEVSDINIEYEFKKLDNKLREIANEKYTGLVDSLKSRKKNDKLVKVGKKYKADLSLPRKPLKPVIDEELDETVNGSEKTKNESLEKFKNILKAADDEKKEAGSRDIDPSKFLNVKTTELSSAIPDLLSNDDNEEETQREVISEAFENDDIVDNFQKDKETDINENQPKNIDLSLPGWGSWGGKDMKVPARKKRRFIIKLPKKMPRKDDNKGNLIINEKADKKIKEHLVSELPFPFKTVKDFEASIRAPIGRTFVPETAHRKLIQPAVITKMGAIIEPMNENILLKKM